MTTNENFENLDLHATRALHELLAGRVPAEEDTKILTGDVKACIDALAEALQADGVQAVRKSFLALTHDRPWLAKLASDSGQAETDKQKRRIRFLPDSEFENRPQRNWLIPKIIPKASVVLVYGPPRCGKSFLTMAWSLCIASGTPWLGHQVQRGSVAYIAAEGSQGLGSRMKAWKAHHGYTGGDTGVLWYDEPAILTDPGQFNELVTSLREDFTDPPILFVVDTLSRCSAGADENSAPEMAKFLAAADILQQEFHCTVLIVHHEGKDGQKGPRGSSALMGNTETVIGVTPTDEGCKVYCSKQKDAKEFDDIALKLVEVRYGMEEEEASAVLIAGNERAEPLRPDSQSVILACLHEKQLSYGDLERACLDTGQKEATFKKAFRVLKEARTVVKVGKLWQINQGNTLDLEVSNEDETD